MESVKWCTRCRLVHSTEDFYRSNYTADGLRSECYRWTRNPYRSDLKIKQKAATPKNINRESDRQQVIDSLIGNNAHQECCWLIDEIVTDAVLPKDRVVFILDNLLAEKLVAKTPEGHGYEFRELYTPTDALWNMASQNKIAA